jgi:hypothetical protein
MANKNIIPENYIESEKSLEKKLSAEIKRIGGWSIKLLSAHLTGLPDRLCLLTGGRLFFAEIKTTKQKPKRIQLLIHEKLRNLGFRVEVIDTSEKIKEFIRDYEK